MSGPLSSGPPVASETRDRASGPLVSLHGVVKRYGQHPALNGLDLEVGRGQVYGFIGPNGAGKTTTIKVMVGLLTEFDGEVGISGHAMPGGRREVHRDLGYLPQHVAFQEWRTVEQTLSTFGRLSGLAGGELAESIGWALSLVGIEEFRKRRVTQLSGGERQKVGLAQAVLHRPKLLVLDEPMAGLDPESRYTFKEVIKRLHREGATVFFSSHILSDVQDVATTIGILSWGRLLWSGTLEDLREHLGHYHDYRVDLSHDPGGLADLAATEGVSSMEGVGPGSYVVRIAGDADPDAVADRLLRALLVRGCRVRAFTPVSQSLEQLYVDFVQRSRPGGVPP